MSIKAVFLTLVITLISFLRAPPIFALVDPLSVPNNRFGIHVLDENDLEKAAALVNSQGGDWGYVTLVIRQNDRNHDKWQSIFDHLRRLHLIPLVRLATQPDGDVWQKPQLQDSQSWADFLNGLNWVTQNRYVILFNEPNHAAEWGGEVKPHEYAQIVSKFSQALKQASEDFFILPAGLDASAPTNSSSMSLSQFIKFMHASDPTIFSSFDGWTAHAYPNPEFSGSVNDRGPVGITSYRQSVALAQSLGLKANPPIFITETGWVHYEGINPRYGAYTAARVADFFVKAFTSVWTDPAIVAITPFTLNYQEAAFDHFSWIKPGGQSNYLQYDKIAALPKISGHPVQVDRATINTDSLPALLVNGSHYDFPISIANAGQVIWDGSAYQLQVSGSLIGSTLTYQIPASVPLSSHTVTLHLDTPSAMGDYSLSLQVIQNGKLVSGISERSVSIIPPPSLLAKAHIWYQKIQSGSDFKLLMYDQDALIKQIEPFTIIDSVGQVKEIRDVVPNRKYRFVLVKPYYLPRQTHAYLSPNRTVIEFDRLLPLDLNLDGQLTIKDLIAGLTHPRLVVSLFNPL